MHRHQHRTSLALLQFASYLALATFACADEAPRVHSSAGVAYISGGIGAEERSAMRQSSELFNLRLTFAEEDSGAFLAGIDVKVYGAGSTLLLDITSSGPLLYVRLPPGRYRLEAVHAGTTVSKRVTLPAQGTRSLALQWPASR